MSDTDLLQHIQIRDQANRLRALNYLLTELMTGPVARSVLQVGIVAQDIPQSAVEWAHTEMGIDEYQDAYGVTMWQLEE